MHCRNAAFTLVWWMAAGVVAFQSPAAANTTPYVNGVSPTAVKPGSPDTLLTIRGAGFAPGAKVKFNTLTLTPATVTAGTITVTLPANSLTKAGSALVEVVNSAAPVAASNPAYLRIRNPATSTFLAAKPGLPVSPVLSADFALPYVAADFDNDGRLDVLYADAPSGVTTIYLQDAGGSFKKDIALSDTVVSTPELVVDLNGDGNLDLVTSGGKVLLGDGRGGFVVKQNLCQAALPAFCAVMYAAADFTGDGVPDLIGIVTDLTSSSLAVFPGLGDGSFSPLAIEQPVDRLSEIFGIGDFTGDGVLDVLVCSPPAGGSLNLLRGTAAGQFVTQNTGLPLPLGTVVAGDFNNDGKLDFIGVLSVPAVGGLRNATVVFAVNEGNGNFAMQPLPIDLSSRGVYSLRGSADLNGDGNLDFLTDFGYYLNDGNGHFTPGTQFIQNDELVSPTAADFDGDGSVDILALRQRSLDATSNGEFDSSLLLQVPETQTAEIADSLSFGSGDIGVWVTREVPVTNKGTATLYLNDVLMTPDNQTGALDFHAQLDTCAAPVLPGQTCLLHVTYHPAVLGPAQAKLTLLGNMTAFPESQLLGTGLQFIDFRSAPTGTTVRRDLPLTERGLSTDSPNPDAVTVTPFPGTPKEDFQVTGYPCLAVSHNWASLPPSYYFPFVTECQIAVTFRPSRPGYEFALLHVYTEDPTPGWRILYLFGKGVTK